MTWLINWFTKKQYSFIEVLVLVILAVIPNDVVGFWPSFAIIMVAMILNDLIQKWVKRHVK